MKYLLRFAIMLTAFSGLASTALGNTASGKDIGIRANHAVANAFQSACIEISVFNFSAITNLSFNMDWDPDLLRFDSVSALSLAGLDAADFGNYAQAANGLLQFDWEHTGDGVSLPDDHVLFQVCFSLVGANGLQYGVYLSNGEAQNAEASNPGVKLTEGQIGRYVAAAALNEFAMELETDFSTTIASNQHISIPIRIIRFTDLLAFQFSMNWDPDLLQLDSITVDEDLLPGYYSSSFTTPLPGVLTTIWISDESPSAGLTLPAGTTLFTLWFTSKNDSGVSQIAFQELPTIYEAFNEFLDQVPLLGQSGFIIIPDADLWPGDVDHNGIVNHFDLLPIGAAYGTTDHVRPVQGIDWAAKPSRAWLKYSTTGVNFKHVDADGDGIVALPDTLAIAQNWGLEVPGFQSGPVEAEPRLNGIPLYIASDTLEAGQTAALDIVLGDNSQSAEAVYGLAFSIIYDPDIFSSGSIGVTFENSWLGQVNDDFIAIHRDNPAMNRLDVALTKIDGFNISGQGPIGQLRMTVVQAIEGALINTPFSIENVRLIDRDEVALSVEPTTTTIWIEGSTATHNPELARLIHLYPVPASSQVILETKGLQITAVQVLDAYGRTVKSADPASGRIAVQDLADGLYVARLETDKGLVYKPLLVAK